MRADGADADRAPIVAELRAAGLSLRAIARRLDAEGDTTRHVRTWSATRVEPGPERAGT